MHWNKWNIFTQHWKSQKIDDPVIALCIFNTKSLFFVHHFWFLDLTGATYWFLGWDLQSSGKTALQRRTTASAVTASAPNLHLFTFKRQSPLVAVVIMTGANDKVRWCYYRATKSSSQQNIRPHNMRPLFVPWFLPTVNCEFFFKHYDCSIILIIYLLLSPF